MSQSAPDRTKRPVQRNVPAVMRAITILRFLAKNKDPVGVVPLARATGLIPSTCLHIVRVLANEGFVTFNPQTKHYSLGPGVLSLASAFSLRNPFVQVVRHRLDELSQAHGCTFAAVEQSGSEHIIVVAVGDVHSGLSVRLNVGMRFPALTSATGRCLAAFGQHQMPPAELKQKFAKLRWDNSPRFDDWLAEIAQVREQGYAIDQSSHIGGVTAIAVPVFNENGFILGCVNSLGLRERFTNDRLDKVIRSLKITAREASRELGYSDSR